MIYLRFTSWIMSLCKLRLVPQILSISWNKRIQIFEVQCPAVFVCMSVCDQMYYLDEEIVPADRQWWEMYSDP